MQKIDLHVHSKHSDHPSEWFLQRLGAAESYTEPDLVFELARQQGMDFVTLTDHNCMRGALALHAKHPDCVFTGVEATAYFPEDGCKVHILIYGLDERQFQAIEKARISVYQLRDYIREQGLAYSVAHASYSVNSRLQIDHLEKLLLLFDVFETQNGTRAEVHNDEWFRILRELTPTMMARLQAKHGIEPMSGTPWIKGFTGGSDDHGGIFIGKTYTVGHARTPAEFLAVLKDKKTLAAGRNSHYRAFAFTIYKIAYDFSKAKSPDTAGTFFSQIASYLFEQDRMGLWGRMRLTQAKRRGSSLDRKVAELLSALQNTRDAEVESRIELAYDQVAQIADEILRIALDSVIASCAEGNLEELFKTVSLTLPGILLSVPFLSAFKLMHADKGLLRDLRARLDIRRGVIGKRLLWFTDTLTDVNGVAITLRKLGWLAHRDGRELTLVTALLDEELTNDIPPNVLNLPTSYHFEPAYYKTLRMKVPSILASLKALNRYDPDEVVISSPGPVGLLGLLVARLLGAKCIGIYHTDFTAEVARIAKNDSIASLVESYTRWFYSLCDEIRVPTHEYIRLLKDRDFEAAKLTLLPRGIDADVFAPRRNGAWRDLDLREGFTLLYVGRISDDKSIGFLANAYEAAAQRYPALNLIVAGDGPGLEALRRRYRGAARVRVLGPVAHASLPELYSLADLFVFPSATDTFGMAVLEAQACGLPALVADIGGPKEIIRDGVTGWVLPADDLAAWTAKIADIADRMANAPADYAAIRHAAREQIVVEYTWERFLEAMFRPDEPIVPAGVRVPKIRAAGRNGAARRRSAQLALC